MDPLTGAVLLLWPMSVRYYLGRISPYKTKDAIAYYVCNAGKQTSKDRDIFPMVYGALLMSATDTN